MAAKVVEFKTNLRDREAVETFRKEILDLYWDQILLLLFHDPKCLPSHTFLQKGQYMLTAVEGAGENVVICKINASPYEEGNRHIADNYGIRAMPTTVFVRKGSERGRIVGVEEGERILERIAKCK